MKAVPLALLFSFTVTCGCSAAGPRRTASPDAQRLAGLKARLMSADYRADIDELDRVRRELDSRPKDTELAFLSRYWSGFASWRMAINGANHGMKSAELATHLKEAAADFYSSMALDDRFADAPAAAALVNSWLAAFSMPGDPAAAREHVALSRALLARAIALDPDNPRVLWTEGGLLLYTPESLGGSIARAIAVYRKMLDRASRQRVDPASPYPDWGKPESLMSLAYAHTRQTPPDLAAARREARAALDLEPEWAYVRDDLLKEIDERSGAAR